MELTQYQRKYLQILLAKRENPAKVGRFRRAFLPVSVAIVLAAPLLCLVDPWWAVIFLAGVVSGGLFSVASVSRHTYRRWPLQDRLCNWDKARELLGENRGVQPADGAEPGPSTPRA